MFHVIQYGSDESWIGHTCSKRNIANLLISTPKRIVEWGYDDLIFHTKNQDTESNKGFFFPLLGIKLSERCSLNAKILAFLGHWCYMETTEKNSWNQDCPGKPQEINIPLWECAWKTKPWDLWRLISRGWWVSQFLSSKTGPMEFDHHQVQKEKPKMYFTI